MLCVTYDSNGNIILSSATDDVPADECVASVPVIVHQPALIEIPSLRKKIAHTLKHSASEGHAQLQATLADARSELKAARNGLQTLPCRASGLIKRFWIGANSPVHLPLAGRFKKRSKTKLGLFVVDTIRFGGTFAGIFVVLFVAINYQSFLQIAKAELALRSDTKTEQGLEQIVNGRTDVSPALDGAIILREAESDLLSSLPHAGPYENRLIIPKLGENVPIVRPGMDALVKEDWTKFEADIQTALKGGVVHYPGSAKPGQAGNFFITGHSSYYLWNDGKYKNVFARLGSLVPGDTYSVYYGGDKHTYRVVSKKEVKPNDVSVLDQPTDKRIATLMTCTPVGTTLRRLIVRAEEIDPSTGEGLQVGEKAETPTIPMARLESLPI